ncbi:hypothetical protein EVAR_24982_1 [Eumeta japonica]|uniref:Uncharacterized protein n=1 Tax=Eumeta variegata TaxID=151549 RepID=A0A4C1XKS1_EUMVA|nr:hypothetical protein EVAR_24982_1 [Eumeta japonica]
MQHLGIGRFYEKCRYRISGRLDADETSFGNPEPRIRSAEATSSAPPGWESRRRGSAANSLHAIPPRALCQISTQSRLIIECTEYVDSGAVAKLQRPRA